MTIVKPDGTTEWYGSENERDVEGATKLTRQRPDGKIEYFYWNGAYLIADASPSEEPSSDI